ncbi:MAG TPA: VWA domain-containing protein [Candidatus Aquilonibacter sp.]|nr:VWA domain-containing protein [Candidatus Aquilonibacter sp.]
MRRPAKLALALCLAALSAIPARTQNQSPTQSQSPPPQPPIRVQTNEVVVPVTVTDSNGELVLDLFPRDFHIFDDGVEQKIDHWDLGGDSLAVALVIETSTRAEASASDLHGFGTIFTETVMALSGEAAVITYDSTVDVRQPFTQDHDAVEKAISGIEFDDSRMHLYDGMATAVDMLKDTTMHRRIMLVLGESRDDGSKANFGSVVREAEHANITIYAIGASSATRDFLADAPSLWAAPAIFLLQQGRNISKRHDLEVATAATGGVHYGALRAGKLREALDDIGGELHAQYILTYKPSSDRPGFHSIQVVVSRSGVDVRARPGYYLAPPER